MRQPNLSALPKRFFFILILAGVVALGALPTDCSAEGNKLGAQIAASRCAMCHGADGRGISAEYPSLAAQHSEYLVKQIFNFKTGQRTSPLMQPVVAELMSVEIRALAAHFSALPAGRVVAADAALRAEGEQLYQNGNPGSGLAACASCHGAQATGGAQLPRLAGQNTAYLENQLRSFVQRSRVNDQMMHIGATNLKPREAQALAAYLSAVD